jgi:hypothetical protein
MLRIGGTGVVAVGGGAEQRKERVISEFSYFLIDLSTNQKNKMKFINLKR